MSIRHQLLASHFPNQLTNELLSASAHFSPEQFYVMYRVLMLEKSKINTLNQEPTQKESQVAAKSGFDITTQILKDKYGK